MIVTIHQPEHLPWLGFFDKMRQADLFVLLDTTQFAKDDVQNRNRVKTCRGPTWLTVPVFKSGSAEQLIEQVRICNDQDWRRRCWNLLVESYRDAPFFAEHQSFFKALYAHQWSRLVDLNVTIIRYLAEQLGIPTPFVLASELGIYERGPTRVNLGICRAVGADVYLSGINGRTYLNVDDFASHNISVLYQEFKHPVYPQQWGEFLPCQSVVDLLFNCGPRSLHIIDEANPSSAVRDGSACSVSRSPTSATRQLTQIL